MANFYKNLNSSGDIVNTRTLLHEAIPLTGTIVSGTYVEGDNAVSVKDYTHGMFQSVYDYPYLSSSANHLFDITVGVSANSKAYSAVTEQQSKKKNIYNQMAQVLMGYDATGSILRFDEDGDLLAGGSKLDDVFFLNFSRLLVKDEIKKGSFELTLGVNDNYTIPMRGPTTEGLTSGCLTTITDYSGSDGYFVNSPVGEYGVLFATGSLANTGAGKYSKCGLIFYQAGIVVLTSSILQRSGKGGLINEGSDIDLVDASTSTITSLKTKSIKQIANGLRNRIYNLQFNNTVELNSTVYFCRINHNEYNYSSNPTYLTGSKLRVKTKTTDLPVSYITTIGLYNDNNELLAVSKLSEPLKKTPDNEFTIRVRLDY